MKVKCQHCEVCGKPIELDGQGARLCLPVIIGTAGADTRHCWCVCNDCKDDFVKRSAKVLKEVKENA